MEIKPNVSGGIVAIIGRVVAGIVGVALIGIGCGLTWWATVSGKPISAVGVGGIFVVGIFMSLAGLSGVVPTSLSFNKDGVAMQLVADTSNQVKKSAQEAANKVAADPTVTDAIVGAKTQEDADKISSSITKKILDSLPATADLTRQALDKLR